MDNVRSSISSRPRAWITGVGAVSCLGPDMNALWNNVCDSRTGIVDGLGAVSGAEKNRVLEFSLRGAREAMQQAGWGPLQADDGFILATTTGQIRQWDDCYAEFIQGRSSREALKKVFVHQPLGALRLALSQHLGPHGPTALLSSACSASTQALGLAAMWIRQGRVRRCLVGGVEELCALTREGFRALQLLAREPSRPFDRERNGINLSEGAAFLCVESAAQEKALAEISGYGVSTDGYHMTGPHPEGDGIYRAMRQALHVAQLSTAEITWVHAHGTGSRPNDLAEGLAVKRLFENHDPWVSSTKWLHGHALGASGALETAMVVRAMQENTVLFTRGLATPDENIPVRHPTKDLRIPLQHVLKSTLGFGGTNAVIVLSQPRGLA